jgi:hypothetical protein
MLRDIFEHSNRVSNNWQLNFPLLGVALGFNKQSLWISEWGHHAKVGNSINLVEFASTSHLKPRMPSKQGQRVLACVVDSLVSGCFEKIENYLLK